VPYMSVYAATKAFDLSFGEGLAGELRGTGIDVLNVCPGVTQTEFAQVARMEKSRHGADPMDVVEASLRRLGRRLTFVHGWRNRTRSLAVRLFPRALLVRIGAEIMPKLLFGKTAAHYRKKLTRQVRQDGDDTGRTSSEGTSKQPRE
jgi:short-subunit dehydrogenase